MKTPPFGFDRPEDSPGFLLWQTTILWQRQIKKVLEPYEISHAQFVIMALLLWWRGKKEAVAQGDIVEKSKLDKMTVSKSLKKLVGMGFVERCENPRDTRAKFVHLTKRGEGFVRKLVPLVESVDADFFRPLNAQEKRRLLAFLPKLVGAHSGG